VRRSRDIGQLAAVAVIALAAPPATSYGQGITERRASSRDWAYALALQRDGKLVAAGRSAGGGWRFALARYTTRGKLDPSFGQGGKAFTFFGSNGYASALAIDRGKFVAAGQAYVGPERDVAVVRYTSRGALRHELRPTWHGADGLQPYHEDVRRRLRVSLQRDGKLVVAANSLKASTDSARRCSPATPPATPPVAGSIPASDGAARSRPSSEWATP
jgi:uncharacterized delta-60 repeat protein